MRAELHLGESLKIIDRAIDVCIRPRATFLEIDREKAGFTVLYRDYLLWLAALPVVARFLVDLLTRGGPGMPAALIGSKAGGAILGYACTLAGVYILALAVNALAPLFGGERDEDQALRLCAYALTPSFVASAMSALPGLGWTTIFGLHAIVLVIAGLPLMMRCAKDRALAYGASAAVVMAVIALANNTVASLIFRQP